MPMPSCVLRRDAGALAALCFLTAAHSSACATTCAPSEQDPNNYNGNTIKTVVGVMGREDCCIACKKQAGCVFWTWGVTSDDCMLRSEMGSRLLGGSVQSGIVNPGYALPGAGSPGAGDGVLVEVESGWGMVFVIIALAAASVYLVVGTYMNSKKNGTAFGSESLPNAPFWGAMRELVGDGVRFTAATITGKPGYQSLGNDKEGPDDQPMPAPRKSEKKSKKSKKSKSEKKSKQNK